MTLFLVFFCLLPVLSKFLAIRIMINQINTVN